MEIGNQNNPIAGSSDFTGATDSSGGGDNAVVALPAPGTTTQTNYLSKVVWSYDDTPSSSGGLNIYAGSTTDGVILALDIRASGVDSLTFDPLGSAQGSALTVELLQGGSSVTGKLNIFGNDQ